jgi:8-oxo-dGTP pyrophosphatase MutT (NUDIX family)
MAFAANMAVFPGGRVDPEDHVLAARHAEPLGIDVADAAARVAAIRETFEEAGLAIALSHGLGDAHLAEWREALLAGESFAERIATVGAALQLEQLVPFARWRPNFAHARTFDTRFYLARLPDNAPAASLSGGENVDLYWISAADALAAADAEQIDVIFPTRRNLERLAGFASFDDAIDSARTFGSRRITPFIQRDGEHQYLCIREDCGYPVTREKLDRAMRG